MRGQPVEMRIHRGEMAFYAEPKAISGEEARQFEPTRRTRSEMEMRLVRNQKGQRRNF